MPAGVFEAQDGYIELLTLEDRQWQGLVQLLGHPAWAQDASLQDPLERSRRGDEINHHVREWIAARTVDSIVHSAQELGVPAAKYRTPEDVLGGEHERYRGLFQPASLADGREAEIPLAPYQFRFSPLQFCNGVPRLGEFDEAGPREGAGPDSHFAGYAPLFGAWGGLGWMTGYPDGPPVEMRHVMDHTAGYHAALAVLAALHQRRRTGRAQYIDLAAREVSSAMIGDALVLASLGWPQHEPETAINGWRHTAFTPLQTRTGG